MVITGYSAIWALTEEPTFNELIIQTSSNFLVNRILENLRKWELISYIDIDYKNLFHVLVARLWSRGAPTKFLNVGKNTADIQPLKAQDLAQQGTKKDLINEPDLTIDPHFNLTGTQLSLVGEYHRYGYSCGFCMCLATGTDTRLPTHWKGARGSREGGAAVYMW
jgi:hypothetical protein